MRTPKPNLGVLYRYDYTAYFNGAYDMNGEMYRVGPPKPVIHCDKFRIVKVTPKGNWIDVHGKRKFVLGTAQKQYACRTQEEALVSFKARKERHLSILQQKMNELERVLELAETADKLEARQTWWSNT